MGGTPLLFFFSLGERGRGGAFLFVLPSVLLQDKALKTVNSYLRAFGAWKCWAEQCHVSVLPVEPVVFSLYLVKLIQENKSVSTINSAVYGVS